VRRWLPAFLLLGSCGPGDPLRYAELSRRTPVDRATPIDPASVLITIHADGRQTSKGRPFKLGAPSIKALSPVLLEVDPDTRFRVVRDAIEPLANAALSNLAFLVEQGGTEAALTLPMLLAVGLTYVVQDGPTRVDVGRDPKQLGIVVAPGSGGAIEVKEILFTYPGEMESPGGGIPLPTPWKGQHPEPGTWTPEAFLGFVRRPDVAALRPYVELKDLERSVSDVLRCLSALRSVPGIPIVPTIPPR
jgi:hypothetical protein